MEAQVVLRTPLTRPQQEIMKLFNHELDEPDLVELKRLLVKFLADKLTKLADTVWEQKQWTNDDMDTLLNTHLRTSYKSNK